MGINFVHIYQCGECAYFGKDSCFRKDETVEMSRIHCAHFTPNITITTPQGEVTAASVTITFNNQNQRR